MPKVVSRRAERRLEEIEVCRLAPTSYPYVPAPTVKYGPDMYTAKGCRHPDASTTLDTNLTAAGFPLPALGFQPPHINSVCFSGVDDAYNGAVLQQETGALGSAHGRVSHEPSVACSSRSHSDISRDLARLANPAESRTWDPARALPAGGRWLGPASTSRSGSTLRAA